MKITLEETNEFEIKSIAVVPSDAKMIVLKSKVIFKPSDVDDMEKKYSKKFGVKVIILDSKLDIEAAVSKINHKDRG